jgi:hypothetical protein
MPPRSQARFRDIAGVDGLKVSETITTPQGNQFRAIMMGDHLVLTNDAVGTVVVTGPDVIGLSVSGILGGIGDALIESLKKLKSVVGCVPVTTNTINFQDGKVKSITQTTTCVQN